MQSGIKSVAFIGATGMLGKPVVRELIAAGFAVTALCRDPDAARKVLPTSVNIVKADLRDAASVERALEGHDAVYLNLQVEKKAAETDWCAEREGMATALAAAKKAGIKRVAYLSSIIKDDLRTDWWVYRVKREAARMVESSGIPFTLFCPSCFMENLTHLQIQGNKLNNIASGASKNFWVSGRDYGKQVARSFAENGTANKTYVVQGPEAITLTESAERFVRNYPHKALKIQAAPLGVLKILGLFNKDIGYMTKIMDSVINHPEPFQAEATWRDLGKPEDTVDSFAKNAQPV